MEIAESFVALTSILALFVVLPGSLMFYLFKVKTRKMETLIKLAELGGNLDPDAMKMLGGSAGDYRTDYKKGLIWLAIGLPMAVAMISAGGWETGPFGLIPVFVGISYLISGKLRLQGS